MSKLFEAFAGAGEESTRSSNPLVEKVESAVTVRMLVKEKGFPPNHTQTNGVRLTLEPAVKVIWANVRRCSIT